MKISACMIVKNEEKNISTCLESLIDSVDEIIVVDTGSTDKTIEIAAKYGAKVYHYEWQDDFAAAKNTAIELAQGEWIIFLDADEYFSADTCHNLRKTLSSQSQNADVILVQRINIDVDAENKLLDYSYITRIFRNRPNLRYRGRIHETLDSISGRQLNGVQLPPQVLKIIHTGYSSSIMKAKSKRNLKILQQRIEADPQDIGVYAYLSDCYFSLGDYLNAAKTAQMDIDTEQRYTGYPSRVHRHLIKSLKELKAPPDKLEAAVIQAVDAFPDMPDFYSEYAMLKAENGEYQQALDLFAMADDKQQCYVGAEPSFYYNQLPQKENLVKLLQAELAKENKKLLTEHKPKHGISACVIARNEAANIAKCLLSFKDIADEMIVVDTGSTDSTKEIAAKLGAFIYDFEWCNDFARAKNFALSKAQGEWVIFLDADEYFTEATRNNISEVIKKYGSQCDGFMIDLVDIDTDENNKYLDDFYTTRIFKNDGIVRFIGKIHESLARADGRKNAWYKLLPEELQIYHTGYSANVIKRKCERNLPILLSQLTDGSADKLIYGYLADCYAGLDDYDNVVKYARMDIEKGERTLNYASRSYRHLIRSLQLMDAPTAEQEQAILSAIHDFPKLPDFYAEYGAFCMKTYRYDEAMEFIEAAFLLLENYDDLEVSLIKNKQYFLSKLLFELYINKNKNQAAVQLGLNLLLQERYDDDVLNRMFVLLKDEETLDLIAFFNKIYDKKNIKDLDFIINQRMKYKKDKVLAYYMQSRQNINGTNIREDIALASVGEYREAVKDTSEEITVRSLFAGIGLICESNPAIIKSKLTYLPIQVQLIIARLNGMSERYLQDSVYEWYSKMLEGILKTNNKLAIVRFAELIADFSITVRLALIKKLLIMEQADIAVSLYKQVLAEKAEYNIAEVLYETGIACFKAENYAEAEKYLAEAVRNGHEKHDEWENVMTWTKEKLRKMEGKI